MPFKVIWDGKAQKELEKLEPIIYKRILKKIDELEKYPYSKDIKRLKKETAFRLRIGNYRIIFEINKDLIVILKVGHRKNIYKYKI